MLIRTGTKRITLQFVIICFFLSFFYFLYMYSIPAKYTGIIVSGSMQKPRGSCTHY